MSFQQARAALEAVLGERLVLSKSDLDIHGRSETHFPETPPEAVAYPVSTEEVAALVGVCAEHGVPVTGWGTGTSLEGHALAVRGGLVVDFTRMDAVLELRPEDMVARVQPGITRERLNEELRATGLMFPVDPGANASIGGMASTRASGTTAVRYGTMRDNVRGLEVVLADGRVIRTGTMARKSSAGYDLTGLFVGAEGTLGLITELTLKLHGQPEAVVAGVCAFDTLDAAVQTVIETIQSGIPMARIEFLDAPSVAAVNAHHGRDFPETPHLFVEFHGSEGGVAEQAEAFGALVAGNGGSEFQWARKAEERSALWMMRHNAAWSIMAQRPGAKALVTDVCVPMSALPQAVAAATADIADSGLYGPILGHVGDGNFHATIMCHPDRPEEMQKAQAISGRMVETALALGGTSTGEHGVGMGKLRYMEAEHGAAWDVMGTIKRALDPENLMNPGKMVRQN